MPKTGQGMEERLAEASCLLLAKGRDWYLCKDNPHLLLFGGGD